MLSFLLFLRIKPIVKIERSERWEHDYAIQIKDLRLFIIFRLREQRRNVLFRFSSAGKDNEEKEGRGRRNKKLKNVTGKSWDKDFIQAAAFR